MFEVWLIIFVLLVILELSTVNLVSIWFAAGALMALVSTLFTEDAMIQLGIFVIVSGVTLFLTKPLVKNISQSANKFKKNLLNLLLEYQYLCI